MPKPTGLSKVVLDVPLKAGLLEKVSPEMSPPEGMYKLENVELDKIGSYARRRGFSIMSTVAQGPDTLPIGGLAPSFGNPKKVAGRGDELFCIAEQQASLGSGGGAGNTGSIVWSYVPEQETWRAHGKVPSTTIERAFGITNGQANPRCFSIGFTSYQSSQRHVTMAYHQASWDTQSTGVHVCVWDVTSRTLMFEDTLLATTADQVKVQVVQCDHYAVIIGRRHDPGFPGTAYETVAWVFSSQNPGLGITGPYTLVASSDSAGRGWTAVGNGTELVLLTLDTTGNLVTLRTYSVTSFAITSAVTTTVSNDAGNSEPGLSIAGNLAHITYKGSSGRPRYANTTFSGTPSALGPIDVSTDTADLTVLNAAISANEVVVVWSQASTPYNSTPFYWRWIKTASTAPATRANIHLQPGAAIMTHPLAMNSRIYLGITGSGAPSHDQTSDGGVGANYGHLLVELSSATTAEDSATGNPFLIPMPVALWSRDVSRAYNFPSRIAVGNLSDDAEAYIISLREARRFDTFFRDYAQQPFPVPHTSSMWAVDIMEIHFSDRHRWQHAEIDRQTVLAGSLPYTYDGDRAHECGFIFRPSILLNSQPETGAAGAWAVGESVFYKQVYEYEDFAGRRWFSDSSYPLEVVSEGLAANPTNPKQISIDQSRPPWFTMKPDGANNFTGRIKVNTYRALSSSPTEYQLLNVATHMIWDGGALRDTQPLGAFTDAGNDLSETESIYTFGGELDNYIAPTCRALIQHRDRLFAIDIENNSLKYTKPFREGRGIEWAREQSKALPQRGMALASLEGSLIVFTDMSILVLDGPGPSPTGVPPDAFARFAVLSQDHGCMEYCGAWRTPRGVVFRSHQGLWLITPQLAIQYVGAAVEDFVRQVAHVKDAALDEQLGCLRLLCLMKDDAEEGAADTRVIVYWYDSDRWSVDDVRTAFTGTKYSSLFHRGEFYYAASFGVLQRSADTFTDGNESLAAPQALEVYRAKMRTGWYRFDSMHGFKRVWRVLATLRTSSPTTGWDVKLTVETDASLSVFVFSSEVFARGLSAFDGTLRAHLKYQKGQRYRVTLEELASVGLEAYNSGFTFTGLGFELGTRRGAAKVDQQRSPSTTT